MFVPRFSKRAKRHAQESAMRARRQVADQARRSGPVTTKWLPGFGPPASGSTRFPFAATINGTEVVVWEDWIEWPREERDASDLRVLP